MRPEDTRKLGRASLIYFYFLFSIVLHFIQNNAPTTAIPWYSLGILTLRYGKGEKVEKRTYREKRLYTSTFHRFLSFQRQQGSRQRFDLYTRGGGHEVFVSVLNVNEEKISQNSDFLTE